MSNWGKLDVSSLPENIRPIALELWKSMDEFEEANNKKRMVRSPYSAKDYIGLDRD